MQDAGRTVIAHIELTRQARLTNEEERNGPPLYYKAETNFVDIVPQAKRLRLSLNVGFHDIKDPRGLCKDVSGLAWPLGKWGR